jgi:predicted transposase YdaD
MSNAWYDDLPEEQGKLYDESVRRIKSAVEKNMSFEQAASLLDVEDKDLKASIVDDALKVLIAEMHFALKKSVEDVAKALKLDTERVKQARAEMLGEVEQSAIDAYKQEQGNPGPEGNA